MLQSSWLDQIFARLLARYGRGWLAMWDGVDMQAVRADWAEQLSAYQGRPEAIKHALANLPLDRPPNAGQFRALCAQADLRPERRLHRLPAPAPVSAERRAQLVEMLRACKQRMLIGGQR